MGTESGKSKAKKTMRVATIFTGVAAATAGMTQVANAQEIAHADARPGTHKAGGVLQPAGRVAGSIRYNSYCVGKAVDSTWFHYNISKGSGYGGTIQSFCFGYKGAYYSPPGTGLLSQCGGNNRGALTGAKNGVSVSATYGHGTTWRRLWWSHFYLITIDSWAGTDACFSP